MIPGTAQFRQVPAWKAALASAVTDPQELLALVGLGPEWLPAALSASRLFPLRVPRGFVARMRPRDPHDPLLRQVLPLAEELSTAEGYGTDPVGDRASMIAPGVLHKYQGRVLLTATGACAVHCRYCFRRHFPYAEANASIDGWRAALAHIAADSSIREVILSGGDPLTLSDRRLAEFAGELETIRHVARLRLHTRLPVVLPERVTGELSAWVARSRLQKVIVVHANHAQELNGAVRDALAHLRHSGATLLNQTVLLKGVNDDPAVLVDLSESLFAAGVLPYYLHCLDRVQGAAHFEVGDVRARELHAAAAALLPGYLLPRLVRELPGAPSKTLVQAGHDPVPISQP
jgi:EF-P beta-lysylation protein EpmB